jgi:Tfp pilus assembly protein PilN
MTKTINLLPWRETSRQLRKQAMLATLLGASVLSVMLVGFVYMLSSSNLEEIIREKKIIEKEIAGLGRSLIEVKGLERKKRDLISKNRVLQNV